VNIEPPEDNAAAGCVLALLIVGVVVSWTIAFLQLPKLLKVL